MAFNFTFAAGGSIVVDPNTMGKTLQEWVHAGSQLHVISPSELTVKYANADFDSSVEIKELLRYGTKVFDAIYAVAHLAAEGGELKDTDIKFEQTDDPGEPLNVNLVAQDLFVNYFYLLTRAQPVGYQKTDEVGKSPHAKFICEVMGIVDSPDVIKGRLATFELKKMDNSWIRHVKIKGLSPEATNRLALGVAGYRLVAPFLFADPNGSDETAKKAARELKEAMEGVPSWNFHPICRPPEVVSMFKSINKGCQDLLSKAYSAETLKQMVECKMLHEVPGPLYSSQFWKGWNFNQMKALSAKEKIFDVA